MKKCTNCGRQVNGPIHYCPFCGTLLPGEKEMTLVGEEDYSKVMRASDCVEVDSKKWNEMVAFYQSHLSTGYAPKGKQLVAKSELAQLRKDNQEYVAAKILNGTNYLGRLNCRVSQRFQTKTNSVGFKEFWRKKVNESETNEKWCNVFFIFLCASYCIIGCTLLIVLINGMGGWGALLALLLAFPFAVGGIYIGEILDL